MDLIAAMIGAIRRACFGLDEDPGTTPDILHLGLYEARVDACADDGSTCDVTPSDSRISARKHVPVRVGVPGSVAVVSQGAIVLLGFKGGDPDEPYIAADWQLGANVQKLIMNAVEMYLGGESGAQPAARKTDTVDLGTFVCDGVGSSFAGIKWTPPGGGAQIEITAVAAQNLTGKISSGSGIVNIK